MNECPKCGRAYLYASQLSGESVLYVHGLDYVEELDDLVKDACCVSEDNFATQETKLSGELQETEFYLDMDPDQTYTGYTDGDTWNGWACPYFSKDEAQKITEAFDGLEHPYDGSLHRATYDEETDAFAFYEPTSDTWETFKGVDRDGKRVYPIGTYAWTWCEIND